MKNGFCIFALLCVFFSVAFLLACRSGHEKQPADPYELFDALKGRAVHTGGWADFDGGVAYAAPESPIIINDELFPDPIDKLDAFAAALEINGPAFIIICGDIDLSRGLISPASVPPENIPMEDRRFDVNSDTVIIGINDARLMFGGLRLYGSPGRNRPPVSNVIIRNITIWDSVDYGLSLDSLLIRGASRVWIDHVKFTAGDRRILSNTANLSRAQRWHDDTLNIREGQVTVSWCEFTHLDRTMLFGSNAAEANPEDRRITLHHNYFHNVRQRVPRTRGTLMHIYNNYYAELGLYAMGPGRNARFVVQNNLFDSSGLRGVVDYTFNDANNDHSNPALEYLPPIVWSSGNAARSGIPPEMGVINGEVNWGPNTERVKPWEPGDFYEYTLSDNVQGLRTLIPQRAGATLRTLSDFTTNLKP